MKIATILDHIDSGFMALPKFQRGYVWSRDQVRGLFDSLYRRHPVGGLLIWVTQSEGADYRGDQALPPGVVQLLLDGQQRMSSLYGVIRGRPPNFFDGNAQAFTGLMFHIGKEEFQFHQPITMRDDPMWIDVSRLFAGGIDGIGEIHERITSSLPPGEPTSHIFGRLAQLLGIAQVDFEIAQITDPKITLDVVVDIFNKVNSGGTRLSKGDLALAKICADWPEARDAMKDHLARWRTQGYDFSLDWLLRSVNTVLTGEAKFLHLHGESAEAVRDALDRAAKHIDTSLNLIAGRLGLDHDRVLFGRGAISVMTRYLDQHHGQLSAIERDKLLFWYAQAAMWGRFSGSIESFIDVDLEALEGEGDGIDRLIEILRLWRGGLRVEPGNFNASSMGARFYPILYMMTRMGSARDLGSGLPLTASLLGSRSALQVHHIFPKAQLYKARFQRGQVNALANFCFLTMGTNLAILDQPPEVYFPKVEQQHPGALASQWIPMDENLWRIENFPEFLEARRAMLAGEANRLFASLLHGDVSWLASSDRADDGPPALGGIADEREEEQLIKISEWVVNQGLAHGELAYELVDPRTGRQCAILDLAWPEGVQRELSERVALLLGEHAELLALAAAAGFRCFTDVDAFKRYVGEEVLGRANMLAVA
ncbi:MAG: DUF262 domain-containing protein [Sphingomonadaceae bacterium]|nr:DUF262 domain-containing protein [Sphingomonadaceae bacterium]